MEKKSKNNWTEQARKRHLAGCRRYQREMEIGKYAHKLYNDLKEYAEQNNYDFESTVYSCIHLMRNFKTLAKNQRINMHDYIRELIEQRQIEKGIGTAI